MSSPRKLEVELFEMTELDTPEVLKLDRMEYGLLESWYSSHLTEFLRLPGAFGAVAMRNERILGYALYRIQHRSIHLASLVVHPRCRRRRIGTQLVREVLEVRERRHLLFVWAKVRETNLPAQLFFQRQKFFAVDVLHGQYDTTSEDAYVMEWREKSRYCFANRITQYLESRKSNFTPPAVS